MNHELLDVQAGFRKGRGTRDQIANILWIIEKARVPEKHRFLLYWLAKAFDCVNHSQRVDEVGGWHHRLNGHEFEWTPGVGDGQGGLACCNSWGHRESDMTEWLNWTESCFPINSFYIVCLWAYFCFIDYALLNQYLIFPVFIFILSHSWINSIVQSVSSLEAEVEVNPNQITGMKYGYHRIGWRR